MHDDDDDDTSKKSLKGGNREQCYKCCALQKTCLHTQPPLLCVLYVQRL